MDRVIKTDKGIPSFTTDIYPDKPMYMTEPNRYNVDGADTQGRLGREYPKDTTGRRQGPASAIKGK